ncbi:hypothetical protein WH91_10210 [Devosia psychrophila]|uniref:Uncharacterized protein n=1 Tax=Devosia psychrophila TaxID=728005 RepID=A0ABR5DYL1_9HYPH|nr:hypothetical protein WH91_10210 [Devosia psychrophila]
MVAFARSLLIRLELLKPLVERVALHQISISIGAPTVKPLALLKKRRRYWILFSLPQMAVRMNIMIFWNV